ncbi:MAG: SDR family oxidoreductase [Anaerolineae bacterium]|jgi:nucleoside-diphosphate-sugar epimerase|nr:SDR family oxidoreductase [Anaerolineae bacterium]
MAKHVIFGTGPVGLSIMQALITKGESVRMVNRRGRGQIPATVEVITGDASDPAFTRVAAQGAQVVYNCTNPPYHQWADLFPPLQRGVLAGAMANGAKLIAMDNLYMYGDTHGQPITEQTPIRPNTRKGAVRAQMAQDLFNAHQAGEVRMAIGRASDFFGNNVEESAMGLTRMVIPATQGKAVQALGNPDKRHTYTYMPDIGRALVLLGEHDDALGQVWHLPSPETITTRQFIERIAKAAGQSAKVQATPKLVLRLLSLFNPMIREVTEMLYEFEEDFVMDHRKFAQRFGDIATPLDQAIQETIAAIR